MNIQKLIILGILKQGPRHGYQIKQTIKKELEVFTSLENKSIYYTLESMRNKGLIKKSTYREPGKIERHTYSLTLRGDKEFLKLALDALLSEKRPFIDIDIPLYFLPYLESKKVLARLRVKKKFLEKVRRWLIDNLKKKEKFPAHHKLLLRHHFNLLNTEDRFVEETIRIVKEGCGGEEKPKNPCRRNRPKPA